ncbi:hemagglutinin protein (plasmid) [Tistrella mobilis]|uniref:hemagglutinin protein n=1 Tax=Tistrella mobilis TaxID=171437 RepID=UPI003555FCBB
MSGGAEPAFNRAAAGSPLYWLADGGNRAGFLASDAAAFGDTITLSTSWTDAGGLWFWLDQAPADPAGFAGPLQAFLTLLPPARGPRFLWIAGLALGVNGWTGSAVNMTRSGDVTTVTGGQTFDAAGIVVVAPAGGQVMVEQASGDQSWLFRVHDGAALTLLAGDASLAASQNLWGVSYNPLRPGALVWTLDLPAPAVDEVPVLTSMGASLRFFAPDIDPFMTLDAPPVPTGGIRSLQVVPLRQRAAVTLYCAFDPLAPLDPTRTRFGLAPFGTTAPGDAPVFDSGYVTALGYGVQLKPVQIASQTQPGFVLAVQPLTTGATGGAPGDVPVAYYLTPDGDFTLLGLDQGGQLATAQLSEDIAATAPAVRVLCGTTGLDYVGLNTADGNVLSFRAGRAAYAPPARADDEAPILTQEDAAAPPALTDLGTTAWSWISAGSAPRYYAQPEDAPFYAGGYSGFLSYLEMAATDLVTEDPAPAFPMVGYAGLAAEDAVFARDIEARGIAPERRRRIGLATGTQWDVTRAADASAPPVGTVTPAVSPPGIAIGYAGDNQPWAWLGIGNMGSSDGLPDLRFTAIDGAFRQALLSNRLFMVLGSAATVMASGSVAYQLTQASMNLIKALPPGKGVSETVWNQVSATVSRAGYPVYDTETAFDQMLTQATSGTITAEETLVFQRFAGLLTPVIGDWLFRMSPRNWAAPDRQGPKNARLIFKFISGRTLADLVSDTAAWNWPEASSDDGKAETARSDIQAIIRTARESVATARLKNTASPYDRFVEVIDDPDWAGVLALSVEVPLDTLPEPLQPLAAGIDPAGFYAHHLGLTATSFTSDNGTLTFDTTSTFGLIDYQDPIDQYFSSDIAFAFKVQQLTVGFENGRLASFTSSAQLMVNRVFGAQTRLFPTGHGNNLILDGVYQSEAADGGDRRDTYVFAMREAGAFQLQLGQLSEMAVDQTRMVTARAADPETGNTTVTAAFQMAGRLRFAEPEKFDPFCWGPPLTAAGTIVDGGIDLPAEADTTDAASAAGLAYSNYAITMSFSLSDPTAVTFTVQDADLTLNAANSRARPNSLFARFPLRLAGLMGTPDPAVTGQASTRTPEAAGFVSISAPLQQGKLTQPWYGLVYEVDLGTLGALAGSVGITVRLLAAWSAGGGDKGNPGIYFGVALPGIENMLGVSLPLQGILDIGFRTIQFTTYEDEQNGRQYLMRLRDFGLHVLGLSFPPGKNDITVFGNPDQTSNTKLGWYAAYDDGKEVPANKSAATEGRLAGPGRKAPPAHRTGATIRAARGARLRTDGGESA